MSDAGGPSQLRPDALFVIACPACQGEVAASGSLCGEDARCPLCASLFLVPFPPADAAAGDEPPPPIPPLGLAEDWGNVIGQLGAGGRSTTAVEPADDLVFQESVRTVQRGDDVIEIRRLSPAERRRRRFRRNLVMIVIGGAILLLIVILNLPRN
jgi:hypothetical protein